MKVKVDKVRMDLEREQVYRKMTREDSTMGRGREEASQEDPYPRALDIAREIRDLRNVCFQFSLFSNLN